jgi:excisionase family DNA binding protein
MQTEEVGQLLTIQEVMATLRVGRTTVYDLCRDGQLELVSLTKRKSRITERSLQAFFRDITQKPRETKPKRGEETKA